MTNNSKPPLLFFYRGLQTKRVISLLFHIFFTYLTLFVFYDYSQDSSGIFWDNDSLAALLALELKADLLVLLSDVDGLYSGPPSDPHSKLIHTYVKERHQGEITFGDKSRVGRGGMTAKVKAATGAAYAGIPVVITRYALFLSASGISSLFLYIY